MDVLDELLSLDVAHAVNTGDTITVEYASVPVVFFPDIVVVVDIPDGEDTAGLGETGLLLDTADSLLENGRDLSGGGLVGVATERVGDGGDSASLKMETCQ